MPCGTTALRGVLVAGLFCQHSKAAMQQAHTPASSPGRAAHVEAVPVDRDAARHAGDAGRDVVDQGQLEGGRMSREQTAKGEQEAGSA